MELQACAGCFEKQRENDLLREEVLRLKQKLHLKERKEKEGLFGSSTSSAKLPVKSNALQKEPKPKGAKPGHQGKGRSPFQSQEADRVIEVESSHQGVCPQCGGSLTNKGCNNRFVLESKPLLCEKVLYKLPREFCPSCKKTFQPSPPAVLPKSMYGNQLITTATVMHYLHGIPLGRVCEQMQIGAGALVEIFHRLSRLFENIQEQLTEIYRQSPVKHADETGWRTNGKNGYAWLFATEGLSIFQFLKTRSGSVPRLVFGQNPLPGVLIVDRYAGYNKMPCALQYCYAHLLREVQDLEKYFPDENEIKTFVATTAPLLSLAMGLRNQTISETLFQTQAKKLASQIQAVMKSDAKHLGIRRIQDIFRDNKKRLYHWAKNRNTPADNNLAERDLRPTVIARKVSFGSQSDAGAKTRSVLMSILVTLKKQKVDVTTHLKNTLDQLAQNIHQDPFSILFPNINSSPQKTRASPIRH